MKKVAITIILILGGMMIANKSLALTVSPPRLEIAANPGQVAQETVKLLNETDKEIILYSSALNFTAQQEEEGVPKFYDLQPGEEELSKWIEIEKGPIVIAPQETKEVPFSINVPTNADPGGHYAALFFSSQSEQNQSGSGVGISEKIGTLILLRVSGDIKEEGKLVAFGLKDPKVFYEHLPVSFSLAFENTGNVHLRPKGEVQITNILGQNSGTLSVNKDQVSGSKNVLPKTSRHFEGIWTKGSLEEGGQGFFEKLKSEAGNFGFGRYKATLNLEYGSLGRKETASVFFWVFPWHLILVVLIAFFIFMGILLLAIRNYNRWIIKQAMAKLSAKG